MTAEPLVLGFDIGGTKTGVVLGTLHAEILLRREIPTPASAPFESALAELLALADDLLAEAQSRAYAAPAAVSAAVGGPLDIARGVLYAPPHLSNWEAAPLKEKLSEHYRLPVLIEHDGNAGALAEYYFGAGVGVQNLIYLTLGTGLGAGLIINGQIYHGASDSAGEVGHLRMAEDGPLAYGKRGSWEGFCSGAGLVKLALMRFPGDFPPATTTRQIVERALAGDRPAVLLVEEAGRWLGRGLALLVDLFNPELIVAGTLGILLGDMLLEPARQVLAQEALPRAVAACRLVPGALAEDLGSVSALVAVVDAVRRGGLFLPAAPSAEIILESLRAGLAARQETLRSLLPDVQAAAELLVETLKRGNKILVFGNGGSAAAASHLAGELVGRYKAERRPLPALALTADAGVTSCIANDYDYAEVFARQVRALAQPGDLAIGLTTSGRSPNVLAGLSAARAGGAAALALTGQAGLAAPVADLTLAVPSPITARIQEEHEAIIHAWCELIDHEL